MHYLRSLILALASSVFALALAPAQAEEPARPVEHKVVYHMNGPDLAYQKAFLNNIQNHINAIGTDKMDAVVVMHGEGLDLLKNAKTDEQLKARIDNLKLQGVHFNVCNNTLVGRKIDMEKDLYDVKPSDIVPSGVAELAKLQLKGYAYIHP